jgi:hypothetical protein
MEKPDSSWDVRWLLIAVAVLGKELWGLAVGKPLTDTTRRRLLAYRAGAWAVGGFVAWLAYHWGFDTGGLDWLDLLSIAVGAVIFEIGWRIRTREVSGD